LIDHECINELKRVKIAYQLNPNNVFAAAAYANQLTFVMKQIYDRQYSNGQAEFAAYMTLLQPLKEVYRKHSGNEIVAVSYLFGISYVPEHLDENIGEKMLEIVNQFPNNNYAKNFCEGGLFFLVFAHVERKDTDGAERAVQYLERMYLNFPSNESIATRYAIALQGVATIQNFFAGRKTAAKLKELAKQYPHNRKITNAHESIKNIFKTSNFSLLLDNKNKYFAPLEENEPRFDNTYTTKHSKTARKSMLESIFDLFTEALAGYDEGIYADDENSDNFDYDSGSDDSDDD